MSKDKLKAAFTTPDVLAIVGTGVSIAATANNTVASWKGLLRNGVERCTSLPGLDPLWAPRVLAQIEGDMIDLLCAAENISQRLGAPRGGEYASWLQDTVGQLRSTDQTVLRALIRLNVPLLTTNYDDLIEEATGLREVTWQEESQVQSLVRAKSAGVLHLHGHWRYPSSVVLGIRSYESILRNEHAQDTLRALLTLKTVVFVGFGAGLQDPNFGALLNWAGKALFSSPYPSFHLCLDHEAVDVQAQHSGSRISAVPYGRTHADLGGFLQWLR